MASDVRQRREMHPIRRDYRPSFPSIDFPGPITNSRTISRMPCFDFRAIFRGSLNRQPRRMPNKSVESNGRVDLRRCFHVVRDFDLAAKWRCPPVPHLLRSRNMRFPNLPHRFASRSGIRNGRRHQSTSRRMFSILRAWCRIFLELKAFHFFPFRPLVPLFVIPSHL